MRTSAGVLLVGGTVVAALCAEFILDIGTPSSRLSGASALGASLSLAEYNKKLASMRSQYGEDRVSVALETGSGRMTVSLDGKVVEQSQVVRNFAGMYGMFVVTRGDAAMGIFPFAFDPGRIPSDREPNIARLRSHFEERLPAQFLAFRDGDWARDSCVTPPAADAGLGPKLAAWLRVRARRPPAWCAGTDRAHRRC